VSNGILGGKEVFRLFPTEKANENESGKRKLNNLILSENAVLVVYMVTMKTVIPLF
jgi:hypothetical protein